MKSLLNEALARHQEAEAKEEREAAKAAKTPDKGKNNDDQEIEKIVESINVSIKIVGCGGGGSNTVNRCSEAGITGAQLCAVNTDAKHLLSVHAPKKILIGKRLTKGLGAGALPEVGEQAAHENEEEIREFLQTPLQVFLVTPAPAWDYLSGKVDQNVQTLGRFRDMYLNCDIVVVTNR